MSDAAARDLYAQRAIGGRHQLGGRPGIVVVDFVRGFTEPGTALGFLCDDEIAATRRLLERARARATPIVFTTIAYDPGLRDLGPWRAKMPGLERLVVGSPLTVVDARLERADTEPLIVKKGVSAFFETNLASMLVAGGVDTVVLCGATTSGCVRATAVDVVQHGFPGVVVRECVADRVSAPHDAGLFDIDAKYCDVLPLEETLAYLDGTALTTMHGTGGRSS